MNKLNTIHHHHQHTHEEEAEELAPEQIVQPAFVFDAQNIGEEVPAGFNAVKIVLDGTLKADLAWKPQLEAAREYIHKGFNIFWEMDLGLFHRLKYPLGQQSQFLSLTLSLEHFRDTVWKEFRASTAGLCLYRGELDFSHKFCWDQEQERNLQGWLQDLFSDIQALEIEVGISLTDFTSITEVTLAITPAGRRLLSLFCRDAVGEYFDLLVNRMPDALPLFALMDASSIEDPLLAALLLHKERYPRVSLGVKGAPFLGGELGWEGPALPKGCLSRGNFDSSPLAKVGICLPAMSCCRHSETQGLEQVFAYLQKRAIPFRVVPEGLLTTDWDGLDYLLLVTQSLSPQGRRKVQGFCAAGGVVVSVGEPLGLPEELPFSSWILCDAKAEQQTGLAR